jgi:hypothetical protein
VESRQQERAQGKHVADDAPFHVTGASAIEAPAENIPTKRGMAPGHRVADFDRIDVPVQN